MPLIEWDDSMGIGLPLIDDQHKGLLALINDLDAASKQGVDRDGLAILIRRLYDYSQVHFHAEESLMDFDDYPDFFVQVNQHVDFCEKCLAWYKQFVDGEDIDINDLLTFVTTWFKNHTTGIDQGLRQYLRDKETAGRTFVTLSY